MKIPSFYAVTLLRLVKTCGTICKGLSAKRRCDVFTYYFPSLLDLRCRRNFVPHINCLSRGAKGRRPIRWPTPSLTCTYTFRGKGTEPTRRSTQHGGRRGNVSSLSASQKVFSVACGARCKTTSEHDARQDRRREATNRHETRQDRRQDGRHVAREDGRQNSRRETPSRRDGRRNTVDTVAGVRSLSASPKMLFVACEMQDSVRT